MKEKKEILKSITYEKPNFTTINEATKWFKKIAKLSDKEMLSTFNCGIGMALIISKKNLKKAELILKNNNEKFFIIGKVIKNTNNEERCTIV